MVCWQRGETASTVSGVKDNKGTANCKFMHPLTSVGKMLVQNIVLFPSLIRFYRVWVWIPLKIRVQIKKMYLICRELH